MNPRAFAIAACLIAACSTPLSSDPGGTGKGGAGGQVGGSGGAAGGGGSGTTGPATCRSTTPGGSAVLLDADGNRAQGMFMVPVSVVSVADCATGACGVVSAYRRIALSEAGGAQWTLQVLFPGLPADIVDVSETLSLSFFDYGDFSSTILSRASTAVIFDVGWANDLVPFGIDVFVRSAAGRCSNGPCYDSWGAQVTYDGQTAGVAPGEAVMVGKLSFFHGAFNVRPGDCPSPIPPDSMAGFTAR